MHISDRRLPRRTRQPAPRARRPRLEGAYNSLGLCGALCRTHVLASCHRRPRSLLSFFSSVCAICNQAHMRLSSKQLFVFLLDLTISLTLSLVYTSSVICLQRYALHAITLLSSHHPMSSQRVTLCHAPTVISLSFPLSVCAILF